MTYLEHYEITPERNEVIREVSWELIEGYNNGKITKPDVIGHIAKAAETKYEAAMMALFVGHCIVG